MRPVACALLLMIFLLSCSVESGETMQHVIDSAEGVDAPQDADGTTPVAAPYEWFTSYGGSAEEAHGHFILATEDGGYLQIGETGFIPNSAELIVAKVDSVGQLLWVKQFGQRGHNLGNSAIETADAYVIVGALNEDSTLIRLDKTTGATLSIDSADHGGSDAYEHVAVINGGFVAVGYKNAEDRENTFFTEGQSVVAFLDGARQPVSIVDVGAQLAHAYRVKTYDNSIFVTGLSEEAQQYVLLKLDANGVLQWSKQYGGVGADHHFGFDQNEVGEMCLTGHTVSGTANWDTFTVKVSLDGDVIWEAKYGNPRGFDPAFIHDEAWGVAATADGGCLIVAGTGDEYDAYSQCNRNGCSDKWQVYLLKLGADGTLAWQKTFANYHDPHADWAGEDVALTSDGNVMIAVDNGRLGFLKVSAQPTSSYWEYDVESNQWRQAFARQYYLPLVVTDPSAEPLAMGTEKVTQ